MVSRLHKPFPVSTLVNPLWPPSAERDSPAATPGAAVPAHELGERAARLGHHLGRIHVSPPGAAPAPVQRVTTRAQKAAEAAKKGKKVAKVKRKASDRLSNWKRRGDARKLKLRFPTGRYKTATGMITMSGLHNQRMTQARKGDYGDETFGSLPPYKSLKAALPPGGVRALFSKPSKAAMKGWTDRQRLATSLSIGLQHGSENDRAPGLGKLVRALARRHDDDPTAPHPLDEDVNPAISTAEEARNLMDGVTPLSADQTAAIDDYASDSSDEDEDEDMPIRKGLLELE